MYDWLVHDDYDYDYDPLTVSTTGLMKPIRATILTARHGDKLEIDVSELIASRYGNALHDSVERIVTPGVSKEQRIKRTVDIDGVTYTVTGKYDLLVEQDGVHTIRDMKSTSVWAKIYGGKDEDYQTQLSTYRWLLTPTHQINPVAYIDFFFTDWQSSKARSEDNYPKQRIHAGHKIELLSIEETEDKIRRKLSQLKEHQNTPDDELPECTKEELWAEEDTFAVYKIGNKRATKVCDTKQEAEIYQEQHNIKGYIQSRPGKVRRCKYCSAAPFCNQFKRLQEYNLIAD
jgi:PD-(D/E)XK nuclease superfamily